jgi:hypothetical protein
MARFRYDEADKYGSSGTRFFALKDDKDTAQVRFMYDTVDDIECFNVHQIDVKGEAFKKRYINCLRSYRDPIDVCPLCAAKKPTRVKMMVPLYNVDTETVQLWDKGKKFINQLTSLFSRYSSSGKSICSNIFDIERNGKKGDQSTTYSIYHVRSDDMTMEDLPDVPDVLGSVIEDMSAEDMERFLESGEDSSSNEPPVSRRSSNRQYEDEGEREAEAYERPVRRTPRRGGAY